MQNWKLVSGLTNGHELDNARKAALMTIASVVQFRYTAEAVSECQT
jgi:hypothetical protein